MIRKSLTVMAIFVFSSLAAATSSSSSPSSYQLPPWSSTTPSTPAPKAPEAPRPSPLPQKPALPLMTKPFGMPGVVGIQNGKWAGTDYLGYLSNHIVVDVEILKGENTPALPEPASLTKEANEILAQANLIPTSDVTNGPLLPFLHVLLIVYPVEKDKFVVFGTCRLFEQVQVMRKNFSPAGFWQAITWENQDVNIASTEQLNGLLKSTVTKLVKAFVDRYIVYNPNYEFGNETGR